MIPYVNKIFVAQESTKLNEDWDLFLILSLWLYQREQPPLGAADWKWNTEPWGGGGSQLFHYVLLNKENAQKTLTKKLPQTIKLINF